MVITVRELKERITELENDRLRLVESANLQVAAINGRIAELKKILDGQRLAQEMEEVVEGETGEVAE